MAVEVDRITLYEPSYLGFKETDERSVDRYTQSPMCTGVDESGER
jgi:hypothetical protein